MFRIEVPEFSLYKTYLSDPFLRWSQITEKRFIVTCGTKAVVAEQSGDILTLWCDDEEFYSTWYSYFDLSRDYMDVYCALRHISQIRPQLERARGIHLMASNVYEVILSCAVKYIFPHTPLDTFARRFGRKRQTSIREIGKAPWYQLPTPKVITMQDGHIPQVYSLCEKFIDNPIRNSDLVGLEYDEIKDELSLRGVGNNVTSMVCNTSLQMLDRYPNIEFDNRVFENTMGISIADLVEWEESAKPYIGYLFRVAMYNYYNPPEGSM